jgi:hypothetical protein
MPSVLARDIGIVAGNVKAGSARPRGALLDAAFGKEIL